MSGLQAEALSVAAGGRVLCRALDLRIGPGECWGLLGANGAGKTTLLHTLAGLRPVFSGSLRLDGQPLPQYGRRALARNLGVLFQDSQDTFPASVLETALSGRYPHLPPWATESPADIRIAEQALALVGLEELSDRQVNTLSGGERRRLALAMLLTQQPRFYLLDEPTNHLDLHHQVSLLGLITGRLRETGCAVFMSLHDVNLVTRFCSHALLLVDADSVPAGPVGEVINRANLERLYRHGIREVEDGGRRYYFPE